MMNRCEDFPCCGHTYDDPCGGSTYNPHTDPHLYCDHEVGFCELPDSYDEDDVEPDEDWGEVELEHVMDAYDSSAY